MIAPAILEHYPNLMKRVRIPDEILAEAKELLNRAVGDA